MSKSRRPKLSIEEQELFRDSCTGIKILPQDKIYLNKKPSSRIVPSLKQQEPPDYNPEYELNYSAEDFLNFSKPNLSSKILKQLKRGQIKIEARLDLHGLTASEAIANTHNFLQNAQQHGQRCLLIIHGKGHFSKMSNPVLKNVLNNWLKEQKNVLAFVSSQAKHGGTGALYVLLKKVNPHA